MKMNSIIAENGIEWVFNRSLYSIKLRVMRNIPLSEKLFERDANVSKIDIFNFNTKKIRQFLLDLEPDKKSKIISTADKAINGTINAFSSIELEYGNPINWHYNPITKKECNKKLKWFSIPDFDIEIGDIKVIWEVSRFTHFLYFARAYIITEDPKYYLAFSTQLDNWLTENPYSYGANYKCGQECTLRMINALMVYEIFNELGMAKVKDRDNISELIRVCYKKIQSNFFYAHKCIRNNHTFTEICGLIIGSYCCQEVDKTRKAYKLLDDAIKTQFLDDGGYTQYSFNYQRFTLQIIEYVLKISNKTGFNIKETEKIKRSAFMLYQVQSENGSLPNYGSNDGALIFPVTSCDYGNFKPIIGSIISLLDNKSIYEPGGYDEEKIWFDNDLNKSNVLIERKSYQFEKSGFYTLRQKDSFIMINLQNFQSRPSHMDQLHIDLWYLGNNILCDSGTYSYASKIGLELASTKSHNTIKPDKLEQMNKTGPFMVYDRTKIEEILYKENSFSGTMISKNGYKHKRTINQLESLYIIQDSVYGNFPSFDVNFHTPYDVDIISGGVNLLNNGKLLCTISCNSTNIEVKKVRRSLYYLSIEEINCISITHDIVNQKGESLIEIKLAS